MFSKHLGAAVAAAVLCLAGGASAKVIYDNGPPNSPFLEVTEARVADDFQFSTDTAVGGAAVFLGGNVPAWDGGFDYQIYTANSGVIGTLLDPGGSVSITPVDLGIQGLDGRDIFRFQFDFLHTFNAQAGVDYFLAIHARSNFGDNDGIFWTGTNPNGTPGGAQFQQNGTGDFANVGGETAFFLTSPGVPEPASWALMIAGFGLAGSSLRTRRSLRAA